jgi:tetratricopeptide (TPR) repeat protein
MIVLARQVGDEEMEFSAHDHRMNAFWVLADRAGIDVEANTLAVMAKELRQPAQHWLVGTSQTALALLEGRLEDSERLIAETFALGQGPASWNAAVSERLQRFALCRELGRLAEVEQTISRSVHEYPALMRFPCALAHIHADLEHATEARAVFDELLALDLGKEHVDAEWLMNMSLLPDVCAFLGDEAAAARLHALLEPYERLYAHGPVEVAFGCIARGMGVLATTMRSFDAAEQHFETAIEIERRMRARPWVAHAQLGLARMLLARGAPGDSERAGALADDALDTYRALDMRSWAARCAAVRGR